MAQRNGKHLWRSHSLILKIVTHISKNQKILGFLHPEVTHHCSTVLWTRYLLLLGCRFSTCAPTSIQQPRYMQENLLSCYLYFVLLCLRKNYKRVKSRHCLISLFLLVLWGSQNPLRLPRCSWVPLKRKPEERLPKVGKNISFTVSWVVRQLLVKAMQVERMVAMANVQSLGSRSRGSQLWQRFLCQAHCLASSRLPETMWAWLSRHPPQW